MPPRTVSAILRRHRVPYLRECDPLTGEVIRASKTTAIRHEHDHPGSLVHMDVKKLGRIGFDYIHSVVDDHSRLAYSEVLPDEPGQTCAAFCSGPPPTSPRSAD